METVTNMTATAPTSNTTSNAPTVPTSSHTEPFRIYILSLDDQMHGIHYGTWIDFRQLDNIDDAYTVIRAFMDTSPTAETLGKPSRNWVITNWEGWCEIEIPRNDYPASLWLRYETLTSLLEKGYSPDAIHDYAEWSGDNHFDAPFKKDFEEAYVGQYGSKRKFAEKLIDATGMLADAPDFLCKYFDYDAFARDLFMTDYYMSDSGYVFRTH